MNCSTVEKIPVWFLLRALERAGLEDIPLDATYVTIRKVAKDPIHVPEVMVDFIFYDDSRRDKFLARYFVPE